MTPPTKKNFFGQQKEFCDELKEWALADIEETNKLSMHSDNPSDDVLTLINTHSKVLELLEIAMKELNGCVDDFWFGAASQKALRHYTKIQEINTELERLGSG